MKKWKQVSRNVRRRSKQFAKHNPAAGRKPLCNLPNIECVITHLGARGDGVAEKEITLGHQPQKLKLFIPGALPNEKLRVKPVSRSSNGVRADILELIEQSSYRTAPSCDVFPACGGCQFQHMHIKAYQNWKEPALCGVLSNAGITPEQTMPTIWTGPRSRRRVTLSFRRIKDACILGYVGRASQFIQPVFSCTIMLPALHETALKLQAWGHHLPVGSAGQCQLNLLDSGVDILIKPLLAFPHDTLSAIASEAKKVKCQRLSVLNPCEDEPVLIYAEGEARLSWGYLDLNPPSGAFLQARPIGENALQNAVSDCVADARSIADIFCGSGTLSAPLLGKGKTLVAADSASSVTHFQQADNKAGYSHEVNFLRRNLFDAPLRDEELKGIDCAIIDPPRSEAALQITEVIKAHIPSLAMISCNPHSFARDAQQLLAAGYKCEWVRMIDQFHLTPHTELVTRFALY